MLKDPCGYYITDHWWENGVSSVIAMGEKTGEAIASAEVCKLALGVMRPRMTGPFSKGIGAYDEVLSFLENDKNTPSREDAAKKGSDAQSHFGNIAMCFVDIFDCLMDGRYNAGTYFKRHTGENAVYGELSKCFCKAATCVNDICLSMGDWRKSPEIDYAKLLDADFRQTVINSMRAAAHADEAAYQLLQRV